MLIDTLCLVWRLKYSQYYQGTISLGLAKEAAEMGGGWEVKSISGLWI